MSQVNRNRPRRGSASESLYTIFEFQQEFPDDRTALDYLVARLYPDGIYCPKCEKVTKHHRENGRPSYACGFCGHHEHPLVGTIFENSATPLHLWLYAIYLMASTRCGISAKQLERELGVTYKTAWRMANKIRSLLGQDDDDLFDGTAELDEAYIGGQAKWRSPARSRKAGVHGYGTHNKTPVIGIAQRGKDGKSGKVKARTHNTKMSAGEFRKEIHTKVLPGSTVYTDDAWAHQGIDKTYPHKRVNHAEKVYVSGDVHVNTIEGFWALLKGGLGGVYHSVSTTHLQAYLDEYVFRYNNRDMPGRGMFEAFISRIAKDREPTRRKASAWKVQPS